MNRFITLLAGSMLLQPLYAQESRSPQGGGEFHWTNGATCVPPAERQRINAMLTASITHLKEQHILSPDWGKQYAGVGARPTAGYFIWPLRIRDTETRFRSIYAISNYVDLNPVYPGQLMDWNCGQRTYDLSSGYNHGGIDIYTWPFGQYLQQEDIAEIIAVADGVIISKDDGHFDKNCNINSSTPWNAVYVGHDDGTIVWYGHMKKNSLTSKRAGDRITAGEYLGVVGSSGNSTGPHLHLETHDAANNIIEPFEGPCNMRPSLWQDQEPYVNPTINAVMTHSAPPVIPNCPGVETLNIKDNFQRGETAYFAVYYRDQNATAPATYQILDPLGQPKKNWQHQAGSFYTSSYWYWYYVIDNSWMDGVYTFKVNYEGKTAEHTFTVGTVSSLDELPVASRLHIYPNPAADHFGFRIEEPAYLHREAVVSVYNNLGQLVQTAQVVTGRENRVEIALPAGVYQVHICDRLTGLDRRTMMVVR